jgi:myxalamid-type polyketide synthase MxaE and MxaD
LAARDRVLAVVRGSAVNQDGRTTGLTAPNGAAQERVLREALKRAGVSPPQVGYVEAHGTGTSLGDPIEVESLTAVFGTSEEHTPCYLGSVKTNIGHLEAAAGIAGLLKVVLALTHKQIPPHLHFERLNPNITFEGTRFVVPTRLVNWKSNSRLVAGVSSFGFGGTNAHVLLEEAPTLPVEEVHTSAAPCHLLVISGHTEEARLAMAAAYRESLAEPTAEVSVICRTAALHRTHHAQRLAVVGRTTGELRERLDAYLRGEADPSVQSGVAGARPRRVAFVFSGHGSEAVHLPAGLVDGEPAFRDALVACDAALAAFAGWSVIDVLRDIDPARSMRDTAVFQPVTFAVQVSLAALWQSWGIRPTAVVGHSLGEIAAAHVAGCLSLNDAARLVWQRSKLMQDLGGRGRMVSVRMTLAEAEAAVARYPGEIAVAACNAPMSIVLSGNPVAVDDLAARLAGEGRFVRRLSVDYAFHSPAMNGVAERLAASCGDLSPRPSAVTLVSSVTGQPCAGEELGGAHWGRNVSDRVQFETAMDNVLRSGVDVCLEIGWHPVLQRAISDALDRSGRSGAVLCSLREGVPPAQALRVAFGRLHTLGMPMNWTPLYPRRMSLASLPPYAWQRRRYWFTPARRHNDDPGVERQVQPTHRWLGSRVRSALHREIVFEAHWTLDRTPLAMEHQLRGAAVVPAAVMLEMVVSAARRAASLSAPIQVEDVLIASPLTIDDGQDRVVQLVLEGDRGGRMRFRLFSAVDEDQQGNLRWVEHVHGSLSRDEDRQTARIDIGTLCRSAAPTEPAQLFERLRERGLEHGSAFQQLRELHVAPGMAVGRIALPADAHFEGESLPPELFEGCLLVAAAAVLETGISNDLYVPLGVERLTWFDALPATVWSHATIRASASATGDRPEIVTTDLEIYDTTGRCLATVDGLKIKRVPHVDRHTAPPVHNEDLYASVWKSVSRELQASRGNGAAHRWMIFGDGEFTDALADHLGVEMLKVGSDHRFTFDGRTATIDATRSDHFDRLLRESIGLGFSEALLLWGLERSSRVDLPRAAFQLAQAVARVRPAGIRLWFATCDAQAVTEGERARDADPSALWGLGATFALEHPDLWGGCLDVSSTTAPADAARFIHDEIQNRTDERIAFRDGRRYVARLEPLQFRGPAASLTIRPDRTCLVTGGLGALGVHLVRWLTHKGARHLLLLTRRAPDNEAVVQLRQQLPPEVHLSVERADVGVRDEVAKALDAARRQLPPIAGVFHLAGVLENRALKDQTWEGFGRVMAAKAHGARHLHELTLDQPLEWFVLFSSIAGLLGSAGQCNYAAANAYLDGLAHLRRGLGLPALSIDWGLWSGEGMVASLNDAGLARLADFGLRALAPDAALERLEQLMAGSVTQAVVMRMDWARFRMSSLGSRDIPILRTVQNATPSPIDTRSERRRLDALEPDRRRAALGALVKAEIVRCLGLPEDHRLPDDRGFFDMGMDSLLAVELQQRLQLVLDHPFSTTATFDYPSAHELTAHLYDQLWPTAIAREAPPRISAALEAAVLDVERLPESELDRFLAQHASEQENDLSTLAADLDDK